MSAAIVAAVCNGLTSAKADVGGGALLLLLWLLLNDDEITWPVTSSKYVAQSLSTALCAVVFKLMGCDICMDDIVDDGVVGVLTLCGLLIA